MSNRLGLEKPFTCISDTFFGLVEKRLLGVRGELLLGLIAEVFASEVEVHVSCGLSAWVNEDDKEEMLDRTYPGSDMMV